MSQNLDLLLKLASSNIDDIRSAARTLAKLRAFAAVPRLVELLNHEDEALRLSIMEALGHIGDPNSLEPLANALGDRQPKIRIGAAMAIANLGLKDVVELLERPMHSDSSIDVRCACARALGVVGTAEAVDVLVAALVNSDEVLLACISEVLGGLGYSF